MKNSFSGLAGLVERTRKAVERHELLRHGESILVGVSGGLDSMVLLHILHELAEPNRWKLTVAHLNHELRGRSSDADERLVCRACEMLGLPIFVERADVRRLAKEEKISLEMAARQARHEFFRRVAAKKGISTIALAHHADDQVELFFIRLLRGSGGEGLAGMKWRSRLPKSRDETGAYGVRELLCPGRELSVEIVRPLLGETKSALLEYAAEHKIKFREDATNASLDILRNRIRHELLPLLRLHYQPALSEVILRSAEIVGKEAELAKKTAEEWLTDEQKERASCKVPTGKSALRAGFSALPVAVQRRCLQSQLLTEGVSPDFELIEHLRLKPEVEICVRQTAGITRYLVRDLDGVVRWRTTQKRDFNDGFREIRLLPNGAAQNRGGAREGDRNGPSGLAGQTTFGDLHFRWKVEAKAGVSLPKRRPGTEYFDAEKVGSKVILRHWRRGDRIQPIGMGQSVKLQDLFVNQKVPQALRHRLVLAESEKGEIFWVEGQRISERFQLTKGTKRRLQWQWMRD